jgi:cysteine-rich repeat protein
MRIRWLLAVAISGMLLLAYLPASATFHLIKIVEIFPGTAASPTAQYIMLQMYSDGQNHVAGRSLLFYNSAGTRIGTITFPADVANGSSQATLLIATTTAQSFFQVPADITISPCSRVVYFECEPWVFRAGKACWADSLDCVAWGRYTGAVTGAGKPFNEVTGIRRGRAAVRRRDIAGSAATLDAGDDTNNSATDFVLGFPSPRNNGGRRGSIPNATCGNGLYEGLEECDDRNVANGDGCSSICRIEPGIGLNGDYDDDGSSDLLWRHDTAGVNSIWRSADALAPKAVTSVSNTAWKIVGKGDFNGDRQADLFWRNFVTGANAIWFSADAAKRRNENTVGDLHWRVAAVGDFNGDGQADVFWRNSATGSNAIWNSGMASRAQGVAGVSNQDWQIVGWGDFDHDARDDLLWRNSRTGANVIWPKAGPASQRAITSVSNLAWKVAGIGDFNADDVSDILWRNASTGSNVIWQSANSAAQRFLVGVTNQAWQVAAIGDFDADGKSDLFWRNRDTGSNVIWNGGDASKLQQVGAVADLAWEVVPSSL